MKKAENPVESGHGLGSTIWNECRASFLLEILLEICIKLNSGRSDSNARSSAPKADALVHYATPRL